MWRGKVNDSGLDQIMITTKYNQIMITTGNYEDPKLLKV